MYFNAKTGKLNLSIDDIRLEFPNVSFPSNFVPPKDYYEYFSVEMPSYDPYTQSISEGLPTLKDDGKYYQTWVVAELSDADKAIKAEQKKQDLLNQAKAERAASVANLKVTTTAGNSFDADETSQSRMTRAITALGDTDLVDWVLADNTIKAVGKAELLEALKLAAVEINKIWPAPYKS